MDRDWYEGLKSEVDAYMGEIRGVPMSMEAHVARFVIHAAALKNGYDFSDAGMEQLLHYAFKCKVVTDTTHGLPN